jgi:hypothetical protein
MQCGKIGALAVLILAGLLLISVLYSIINTKLKRCSLLNKSFNGAFQMADNGTIDGCKLWGKETFCRALANGEGDGKT